jgi:acyl carrier protein
MEEKDIMIQVSGIFCKVLKKDNITLAPTTTTADIDGWDSLSHMMIIDSIEKHFSIKFKLMEIMKFNNVGDMVACINKKLTT